MPRPKESKVTVRCAACGQEVERWISQVEKNSTGRFFCSASCRAKIGSKPRLRPESLCEICGKSYYPASYGRTSRFCSKPCMNEWQARKRVTLNCKVCGKEFTLSPSVAKSGVVHCSKTCGASTRTIHGVGREHNGKPVRKEKKGYLYVWEPDHPDSYGNGWILEHRLVAAHKLGRRLATAEQVHHINGVKTDNRPENLSVMDATDHTATTKKEEGWKRQAAQERIRELEAHIARLEDWASDGDDDETKGRPVLELLDEARGIVAEYGPIEHLL